MPIKKCLLYVLDKNVVVILGEDISDKPEFSIYNHLSGSKDIFSYESFQENPVALYSFLRKFYFNFHFVTKNLFYSNP